jgi:2-methylisocitrate lyase-like PEP mutase family enzyme
MAVTQRALATAFRALHIPGKPIILTNVYDAASARAIAEIPASRALATASYAVAVAAGSTDDGLTLEKNLAAVQAVATVAKERGLPLTVDFQDGYGDRLEEGIEKLLTHGVVGINLEDFDKVEQKLIPVETAAERVKRVLAVAKKNGVDDFVVNARTDSLLHSGTIPEAITRGKAYLAAGATTIFVLGGTAPAGGMTKDEVTELVRAFDGKLNVGFKSAPGRLTVKELSELGVARISLGPTLQFVAMKALKDEAEKVLSG